MYVLTYRRAHSTAPVRQPGNRVRHHGEHSVQVKNVLKRPSLQPKLAIGSPNDRFEQEADQVADQILRTSDADVGTRAVDGSPAAPAVQRRCAPCEQEIEDAEAENRPFEPANLCPKCRSDDLPDIQRQTEEEEEEEVVRAKPDGGQTLAASHELATRIQNIRRAGRPLPGAERAFFEPRLGADLSTVRLHTDAASGRLAADLGARAFTVGQDIFFGREGYAGGSPSARRLLAHELVHTRQQGASRRIARQCQSRWNAIPIPRDASSLTARVAVDMGELRISDNVSVSPVVGRVYVKFILPRALQERIAPSALGGILQRVRITADISGSLRSAGAASAAARYPNNELCLSVGFSQTDGDVWQANVRILAGTQLEIPLQIGAGTPLRVPPASALGTGVANVHLRLRNDLTASVGALRITGLSDFRAVWSRIVDHVKNALQIPISNIRVPLDARLRAALAVPVPIPGGATGATGVTVETLGDVRLRADVSSATGGYRLRLSGETSGSVLGGLVSLELSGRGRLYGAIPSTVRLGDLSSGFLSQLLAQSSGGGQITGRLRAFGIPGQLQSDFRIVNGRLVGNASLLTPIGVGGGRYGYTLNEGLSAQMGMVGLVNLTIAPAQERLQGEAQRRSTGPQPLELGASVTGFGLTGLSLTPSTTAILSVGVGPQFVTRPTGEREIGVYGGVDFRLRFPGL